VSMTEKVSTLLRARKADRKTLASNGPVFGDQTNLVIARDRPESTVRLILAVRISPALPKSRHTSPVTTLQRLSTPPHYECENVDRKDYQRKGLDCDQHPDRRLRRDLR